METTFTNSITKILHGRSIFLIGMMASGKSKTGPLLASYLNYKFIDTDSFIEKLSKKSINRIFSDDGENKFRKLESKCLQEIIRYPSLVVSTGGGLITKKENWGILRQGIVVWIDVDKEVLLARLDSEKDKRPLLNIKDLRNSYTNIFNSRKSLYSQADIRVQVLNENVDEVVSKILYEIKKKVNN